MNQEQPNNPDEQKNILQRALIEALQKVADLYKQLMGLTPKEYMDDSNIPVKRDYVRDFCLAIQAHEGYFAKGENPNYPNGTRSWRNKNPGNLRYIGQKRAIGHDDKNFCIFASYADGFQELKDMIVRACTGKSVTYKPTFTILQFFQKYAPSQDNNNPLHYAQVVAAKVGKTITTQIKELV